MSRALPLLLLLVGCEGFFVGPDASPYSYMEEPTVEPLGTCYRDSMCISGTCREIGTYERCAPGCEADADCAGDTRCTDTPAGRICLPRCAERADCPSGLQCVRTPAADRVCYADDATSGEVVPSPEPILRGVVVGGGGGWLVPGETASVNLRVANLGSRPMTDVTATVIKGTPLVVDLTDEAGGPFDLSVEQERVAVTPRVTLSPDAEDGAPVPLTLKLVDGDTGQQWLFEIVLTVGHSAAEPVVSRWTLETDWLPVSGLHAGQSARIELYAVNVGLQRADGVRAMLTPTGGTFEPLTTTPQDLSPTLTVERLVARGTLTAGPTASGGLPVEVVFQDAAGATWPRLVTIPVLPRDVALTVLPTPQGFGNWNLAIRNDGTTPVFGLQATAVASTTPGVTAKLVSAVSSPTLEPGATSSSPVARVRFTPDDTTPVSGTLTLTDEAAGTWTVPFQVVP